MQRFITQALRLTREPQTDHNPLARPDGGWYPGKHFDPTDVLTDPRNWTVWKQFILFFVSILFCPVAVFLGVEYVLRNQFQLALNKSTTAGAICAMLVLQVLMFTYARLAVIEDKAEWHKDGEETQVPSPNEEIADQTGAKPVGDADKDKSGDKINEQHASGDNDKTATEPATVEQADKPTRTLSSKSIDKNGSDDEAKTGLEQHTETRTRIRKPRL